MHDLARFELRARAQCHAGASDLVHLVVKIVLKKGVCKDFYASGFIMSHQV